MLITLIFVAITIICVILHEFIHNDDGWMITGMAFGAITAIIVLVLLCSLIAAPGATAALEREYIELNYKINHIEEYNPYEVQVAINDWNEKIAAARYKKESPWINWFEQRSLEKVDTIELLPY